MLASALVVRMRRVVLVSCALAGLCMPLRLAGAAEGPVDDPALIARAKQEGKVVMYAAMAAPQLAAEVARFKATYGIDVQTLTGGSPELVSRLATEQRGGRFEVDLIGNSGYEEDEAKRLGLMQPFRPPEAREYLAGAVDPDGYWVANLANTDAIAYNPDALRSLQLAPPHTWEDLARPAWRGRFGMYADGVELYAALKGFYGKERTDALFRALAGNAPRMISNHTLATNLVMAGDVPAAADIYAYAALGGSDRGRPVVLVNPTPTVIELGCTGLVKNAPHPNAAQLFDRWLLSRPTQQWIRSELHRISMRKDVQNDRRLLDPKVRYVVANPANSVNARTDIADFKSIFGIPN
jgi:iron(III) transport system substrate-binding protein